MNIKLFNTTSPKIAVNKTLNLVADITGEPHNIVSETDMSVRLTVGHLQGVQGSNYCQVVETGKYYFISPNYEINNHTVVIHLHEDVLMSLRPQLLQQTCTVSRNARMSNAYMFDNGYQLLAYENIVTKSFPQGLTDEAVVLLTVG